jgi:hypothetical protein
VVAQGVVQPLVYRLFARLGTSRACRKWIIAAAMLPRGGVLAATTTGQYLRLL